MLHRKIQNTQDWNVALNNRHVGMVLLVCLILALPSLAWAARPSDSNITYWVKDALRQDARVDASEITVSTTGSIVTLSGSIDNLAAKKYANLEAKKINGVLGVINKISVSPKWRSDADILNAVRRRFLSSPVIESQKISVKCADGKVTLSGKVNAYSELKEAELLTSEVRGVKEVENNITINWTTKRSDQEIKNDAVAALNRDIYLTDLPITVTVRKGLVTLAGSVGSAYEKDRARNDVRWVRNVKSVENNLKVEYWENGYVRETRPSPSDADLNKAVRNSLDQDTRLNASEISIEVSYGGVTLNGSVDSHYEKDIAERDARDVVGVGWVTNNLFTRIDQREDWAVLEDVQFNLSTDATTEGFDIDVTVKDGVVTLSGDVHTWYEKLHAGEIAGKVKGVKKVYNQITVYRETARSHSGTVVAKDINKRLKHNWATGSVCDRINVTVKKGVATLTGDVDTWAQRREAENVAFGTEGVWKVDNRLTVKGYDYNWENWYSYYENPYYPWYLW